MILKLQLYQRPPTHDLNRTSAHLTDDQLDYLIYLLVSANHASARFGDLKDHKGLTDIIRSLRFR